MSIFDRVKQDEFDQYRNAMSVELQNINIQLQNLTHSTQSQLSEVREYVRANATVSDEAAKEAATSAIASLNNIRAIEQSLSQALQELNELKTHSIADGNQISGIRSEQAAFRDQSATLTNELHGHVQYFTAKKSEIDSNTAEVAAKIAEIHSYLQQCHDLPLKLEQTNQLLVECKKLSDSIHALLDHSVKRKAEIDELYNKIYGEDISNSTGQVEHIDGLKDELETSYLQVSKDVTNLEQIVQNSIQAVLNNYQATLDLKISDFQSLLKNSSDRFEAVDTQLTGLLPGGMAAGLSAAYEEKKNDEIKSSAIFEKSFQRAILAMIGISLIPLLLNIYLIFWKKMELLAVVKDTPNIIIAILPLYFPVLWLAYSANKKSNLSKRLIEEYTHKSVLGKTFSGLSNQIETLQHQGAVKEELRTKLLFNVLQVSAENPGKLITNYNKSDHPLMDALENSAKLADSVSALAKIPGFSSLANKLAQKADNVIRENSKKVETGLDVQETLEASDSQSKPD